MKVEKGRSYRILLRASGDPTIVPRSHRLAAALPDRPRAYQGAGSGRTLTSLK